MSKMNSNVMAQINAAILAAAVPEKARRFDTYIDCYESADGATFRVAIRRLDTVTKVPVAAIITPPLATATMSQLRDAAVGYGDSRRNTTDDVAAARKRCSRSSPFASFILALREDGALPDGWQTQRDRNAPAGVNTVTGSTSANGVFTGTKPAADLDDSQAPADMPQSTESVPFN